MEQTTVLKISHLSKHLGSRLILNDISLEVNSGEIFGFLGPNGSGKTTTIKVVLGLLSLERGEIEICGHNIKKEFKEAMSNIGGIIESPEMYGYLSGLENLKQYVRMYDDVPESRIDEVVELVGLTDRIKDKVSKYSLGMKQRLGLAQALLNKPKLLILDEPTNGLDPVGIKDLRDILKKVSHDEGTAVFISSHQLAELDLMCDRFGVIDKGKLIAVRKIEEIRTDESQNIEEFDIVTELASVEKACDIVVRLGNTFSVSENKIRITADINAGGKGMSDTVRELVIDGVPILSANPVKHSLEDAFIKITTAKVQKPAPIEVTEVKPEEKSEEIEGGDIK